MQHEVDDVSEVGWKSFLWMAACCVPMIAVVVLISLGYWGYR